MRFQHYCCWFWPNGLWTTTLAYRVMQKEEHFTVHNSGFRNQCPKELISARISDYLPSGWVCYFSSPSPSLKKKFAASKAKTHSVFRLSLWDQFPCSIDRKFDHGLCWWKGHAILRVQTQCFCVHWEVHTQIRGIKLTSRLERKHFIVSFTLVLLNVQFMSYFDWGSWMPFIKIFS